MENIAKTRLRRTLWIVVPALVLAVGALSLPRALAWGHHHARPTTSAELASRMNGGIEHLLDRVDASDAQRERASALAEQRAPALFALMGEGRALRQQLKQALLAEQLDRARLDQLRGQIDALAQRAAGEGLDAVYALSDILTPAQRQQVAEHLARFDR
jgi:Spy/CpxP family protein refolding chaperone